MITTHTLPHTTSTHLSSRDINLIMSNFFNAKVGEYDIAGIVGKFKLRIKK